MLLLLLSSHAPQINPLSNLALALTRPLTRLLQLPHVVLLSHLLHLAHVRLLLGLRDIPLLAALPVLLLLLLTLLLRRRRTAGIEPARHRRVAPHHLAWPRHAHPDSDSDARIAAARLLGAAGAGGVGVACVGRLGGGGGRLLLAASRAGVLRAGRVPAGATAAAEGVVVLVVRVVRHACCGGALGLVATGLAAQVERVGLLLLLLLLAGAGCGPGVVLLLLRRECAADGGFGLDTAVLRAPCGLGRDWL